MHVDIFLTFSITQKLLKLVQIKIPNQCSQFIVPFQYIPIPISFVLLFRFPQFNDVVFFFYSVLHIPTYLFFTHKFAAALAAALSAIYDTK
jgi:hypothetical protein